MAKAKKAIEVLNMIVDDELSGHIEDVELIYLALERLDELEQNAMEQNKFFENVGVGNWNAR